MQRLIILAAICTAAHAVAQPLLPATTRADLSRLIALAAKEPDADKLTSATQGRYPTAMIHGRCMVGFLGKLQEASAPADDEHITWGACAGDIISFRIDAYHLDRLYAITGISYAELAHTLAPALDKVIRAIHADSVQQGINLPQSFTGRDVLIGVTDWGFDYSHPMFYDTAMTATRIQAAWDQSKQSGPAPSGYNYGTTYTGQAELLMAQSDTVGSWGIRDLHGTHVAGIAGGGGAGTAYRGVAFDAGFLFVSTLLDEAAFLDGFAWMRDQAQQAGKRLVINLSLGKHDGTLDGNSLWSQSIDQISDQGVLFVCANGNDGGVPFHIRHDFSTDTVRTRVQFLGFADPFVRGQKLALWGGPGASFCASLAITDNNNTVLASTPWYGTATPPAPMDSVLVAGNDTVHFMFASETAHPLNGRPNVIFDVTKPTSAHKVALMFTAVNGTVHAWNDILTTNGIAGGGQAFQAASAGWTAGDDQYAVSEPACTESVIAVGAYSSEYQIGGGPWFGGAWASFTSSGPTLDERLKPEISAPGMNVASSINSYTDQAYAPVATVPFMGRDYPFARLSGTSMAAPAVTGAAALLLEAAPLASPADIKAVIMATARTDSHTGVIPPQGSTQWGMGKLNVYHALVELLGVVHVPEEADSDVLIWPNPAEDVLYALAEDAGANMHYVLVDVAGRTIEEGVANGALLTIDLHARASGVYTLCLNSGGTRIMRRIAHP